MKTRALGRFFGVMLAGLFLLGGPAAWAQVAADGSIVTALVRPDSSPQDNDKGEVLACGTVAIEKRNGTQKFSVNVRNLTGADLGVFISSSPKGTNGPVTFVNVLSNSGELNDRWKLNLSVNNGVPPQLGVADVNDLVGQYVLIADATTNVVLQAYVPPLVEKLTALNYNKRVKMLPVAPAASPKASGTVRTQMKGTTGAATLDARGKKLAAGNSYCFYVVFYPDQPAETCAGSVPLENGKGFLRFETGRGEDLPFGIEEGVVWVQQLSGLYVEVRDAFGVTHLRGQIP